MIWRNSVKHFIKWDENNEPKVLPWQVLENKCRPSIVAHACYPRTLEAEAGRWRVQNTGHIKTTPPHPKKKLKGKEAENVHSKGADICLFSLLLYIPLTYCSTEKKIIGAYKKNEQTRKHVAKNFLSQKRH